MKNNRSGQAAIISDRDYAKIRSEIKSKKYKLLFDIARYTGERWGCIIQLKFGDVFSEGRVKDNIIFRSSTRKASPDGKRHTREVPIHPHLEEMLGAYTSGNSDDCIFPGPGWSDQPISLRAADFILRAAIDRAGLTHKGYSTHSTRRTFITRLWEKGVDIHLVQKITGHQDLKSLIRYVECNPDLIKQAIANLWNYLKIWSCKLLSF